MDAEVTFLNDTAGPWAIPKVVRIGIYLLSRNFRGGPVEMPGPIRTRCHAITTANTPVVVDDYYSVRLHPCSFNRTGFDTGRVVTLHALHGKVVLALDRHRLRLVVVVRVFEIEISLIHLQYTNVLYLGFAAEIIFRHTGMHTVAISLTA